MTTLAIDHRGTGRIEGLSRHVEKTRWTVESCCVPVMTAASRFDCGRGSRGHLLHPI